VNFAGQHVIITGGSSGIGKATAQLLASLGANISIIGRTLDKLEAAQIEIEAAKSHPEQRIITIAADVAAQAQAESAIAKAIDLIGVPDILITAAGIAHPGYFHELPIEVFEQTMAINYFGTLYTIKAALPLMMQQQKGHLVLISSGAGLIGIYGYTPYSPTKFAVRGLAESLRGELKLSGIRVSIVYPPDTETPQLVAENKTKPDETKLITGTAKTWSAENVARVIVRGIERKNFQITPGIEMSLLACLHSFLSPLLQYYFDKIVTKASS
jgi:3-dehydrosphinganine reductase